MKDCATICSRCVLVPGERLSERNLERRLGASRTPIREALMRLEAEGLVQRGEGGLRVAPLDLDELLEVFELRHRDRGARRCGWPAPRADHARLDAFAGTHGRRPRRSLPPMPGMRSAPITISSSPHCPAIASCIAACATP